MKSNIINIVNKKKQQAIKLFVVLSVAIFVLVLGWRYIIHSDIYQSFNFVYNNFTAKIVTTIGSVFGYEIEYLLSTNLLRNNSNTWKLIMPVDGYIFFCVGFILLGLVSIKQWTTTLSVIIFVLLFVAIRAAIISFIMLMYKGTLHNVLLVWIDPVFFIPLLVLALYIIKNTKILNLIYQNIEKRFSEILNVSLSKLLFLLIIIPPLPRVIFTYLHSEIMPSIVSLILYFSKLFLALMGKTSEISGRFIYLENNWIDLEYPCLGLGVFTLIAVLIFAIRGDLTSKIVYLFVFAFIYSVLNALRLSVLLLYINSTYQNIGLNKIVLHDVATYFMFIVAFVGFLGYWYGVHKLPEKELFQ